MMDAIGSWGSGSFNQGFSNGLALPMMLLMIWSVFWKGLALWHSSRNKEPLWFVAILLINTAGILELIYLFGVAKIKFDALFKVK